MVAEPGEGVGVRLAVQVLVAEHVGTAATPARSHRYSSSARSSAENGWSRASVTTPTLSSSVPTQQAIAQWWSSLRIAMWPEATASVSVSSSRLPISGLR